MGFTETKASDPEVWLLRRRTAVEPAPLTDAETPSESENELIAATTLLRAWPLTKENVSVPLLPATSMVRLFRIELAGSGTWAVCAEAVTSAVTLIVVPLTLRAEDGRSGDGGARKAQSE